LFRQGGQDSLADPPDRVADELHALVRIELPGRCHQTDVALLDQLIERHAIAAAREACDSILVLGS
jgi:hypothetical protein